MFRGGTGLLEELLLHPQNAPRAHGSPAGRARSLAASSCQAAPDSQPWDTEKTTPAVILLFCLQVGGVERKSRPESRPGAPQIGVFSLLHPTEGEMLTEPAGAAPAAEQMLLRTCEAGSGDVLS